MRIIPLAALIGLLLCGQLHAAITVEVVNNGDTTSHQNDPSPGFLEFQLFPLFPFPLAPPSDPFNPATVELTEYDNFDAEDPVPDGFVNATLPYDLTVTISEMISATDIGIIVIGGTGVGGYSPGRPFEPFIDDRISSLTVNGTNVAFVSEGEIAKFSLAQTNSFLNIRLYDPNPFFDRINPELGLAFDITETDDPLYNVVSSSLPEPGSFTIFVGMGVLGLLGSLHRRKAARQK